MAYLELKDNKIINFCLGGGIIPNSIEVSDSLLPTDFLEKWTSYKYVNGEFVLDENLYRENSDRQLKDSLRARREEECFKIVNRGELWYKTLTETQKEELNIWYQQWLKVTDTLYVPKKPYWL